jgi:hypothetical protein
MRHVSPELALVDPELAERLRASLPDPPDCLAPRLRVAPLVRADPVAPIPPPLAELVLSPPVVLAPLPGSLEPPSKSRRRFERALNTALWTPLAAVVGSSLLAFIPTASSSQPRLEEPTRPAPSSSSRGSTAEPGSKAGPAAAPHAQAPKPSKLVLRWDPVDDADFYDVVVVAGGTRRDFWPAGNHLALGRGDAEAATPIRWYVYPAYRVGGVVQFGKLHAQGQGTAILP